MRYTLSLIYFSSLYLGKKCPTAWHGAIHNSGQALVNHSELLFPQKERQTDGQTER